MIGICSLVPVRYIRYAGSLSLGVIEMEWEVANDHGDRAVYFAAGLPNVSKGDIGGAFPSINRQCKHASLVSGTLR